MINNEFILQSTDGELISGNTGIEYLGISIDSRRIKNNDLFIAIKGENHDGHYFIKEALDNGAAGAVIEQLPADLNNYGTKCIIKVRSTIIALGQLANSWRKKFSNLKVICITGSNGKTTTKEMAYSILSVKNETLKNSGNLNNQIGLPLTLLKLGKQHKICITEIGMNDFGEIRYLTDIAEPDIGTITNVGRAHLENLLTVEGVAKAKGELVERFNQQNTFIINSDDKNITGLAAKVDCNKIMYSMENKNAEIHAENIVNENLESIKFNIVINDQSVPIKIKGIGKHNVMNALCAAGIAHSLGYSQDEIKEGFESYKPVDMRLEIIDTPHGFKIINDSYNANPDSMIRALEELSSLKNNNKIIAVLGDMLELGEYSSSEHMNIGEYIKTLCIDMVITYGDLSKNINKSLNSKIENLHVDTHEQAAQLLIENAGATDIVLLKGSRGMKMENTIKFLY